jgi:hypothetical protein
MKSGQRYLESDLVNLLISMTYPLVDCPRPFYEAGYTVEFLEREFFVKVDGEEKEFKFDLVINNRDKNMSIGFECKSGHTDGEQLKKYSSLDPQQFAVVGGVFSHNPKSHQTDVALVFNESNRTEIEKQVKGYHFPLLSVTFPETSVINVGMAFKDSDIQNAFRQPLQYAQPIPEILRVGTNTPPEKFVLLVAAELVAKSASGQCECTVEDLAPGVVSAIPGLYPARVGQQLQKHVKRKIEKVLREGSKYELQGYIRWNSKSRMVELLKIKPGCRLSTLADFMKQAKEMAERLRTGAEISDKYRRRDKEIPPNQFQFLDKLDIDD